MDFKKNCAFYIYSHSLLWLPQADLVAKNMKWMVRFYGSKWAILMLIFFTDKESRTSLGTSILLFK